MSHGGDVYVFPCIAGNHEGNYVVFFVFFALCTRYWLLNIVFIRIAGVHHTYHTPGRSAICSSFICRAVFSHRMFCFKVDFAQYAFTKNYIQVRIIRKNNYKQYSHTSIPVQDSTGYWYCCRHGSYHITRYQVYTGRIQDTAVYYHQEVRNPRSRIL